MSGIPSQNIITGEAASKDGFNSGLGGHASGGLPGKGYGSSGLGSGDNDGFNAGLGGHASGAIPKGSSSNEPTVSGAYSSGPSHNALTGSDGARSTGAGVGYGGENLNSSSGHSSGTTGIAPSLLGGGLLGVAGLSSGGHAGKPSAASSGTRSSGAGVGDGLFGGTGSGGVGGGLASSKQEPVSGAYEGGPTSNALTGESDAVTTGKGVGYDGENLHQARGSALSSTAGGALAGAGVAGAGAAAYGTGVGASGGSGAHYSDNSTNTLSGAGTGSSDIYEAQRAAARGTTGDSGLTSSDKKTGAGLAAGAAGAGAAAGAAGGAGKFGNAQEHEGRGEPISDPSDIDSGGRHGLVFNESTGKYEHRHILEEKK